MVADLSGQGSLPVGYEGEEISELDLQIMYTRMEILEKELELLLYRCEAEEEEEVVL